MNDYFNFECEDQVFCLNDEWKEYEIKIINEYNAL